MGAFTHVLTYDGGVLVTQLGSRSDISVFSNPLHHFNGDDQWGLGLSPLPADKTYDEMLSTGELSTEFIQAGGLPDAMTVEIRKPGGRQWVRHTVGDPQCQPEPIDVPIDVAGSVKMVSRSDVFDADEATALFWSYYTTGGIPGTYALRAMHGYALDGPLIEPSRS